VTAIPEQKLKPEAIGTPPPVKMCDLVQFCYRNTGQWFPAIVLEVAKNDLLTLMVCNHHAWIRERNVPPVPPTSEINWDAEMALAAQGSRGNWRRA